MIYHQTPMPNYRVTAVDVHTGNAGQEVVSGWEAVEKCIAKFSNHKQVEVKLKAIPPHEGTP